MLTFKAIEGKNYKIFVKIDNIETKEDIELMEHIENIVSRTEYFPFIQGFNKNQSYTYFYDGIYFPIQFWFDVKEKIEQIATFPIVLENEEIIYDNEINWDLFKEWVDNLVVPDDIKTNIEEYLFQQESAFEAIKNKSSRIEIGTSGGKTFITYLYCRYLKLNYYINQNEKILIVVPSKDLVTQLRNDFNHYQKHEKEKLIVETIYSGAIKFLDSDIVCGTYQSLREYEKEYFDDFKVLVCDEVHKSKAYSIKNEIFTKTLKCEYFFGMSGTHPKYNTLDYLHIVSMFGKLVYKKEAYSLIEDGISTPVKIKIIKLKYSKYSSLSEDFKNKGILGAEKYREEKRFFQTYEPRTKIISDLIDKLKGNSLILVDTVEYCMLLKEYFEQHIINPNKKFFIIHGKINNRDIIFDEMRNGTDCTIIATYGTMSTGISIKTIDYIFFPDGGKSEIRIRQSIGRGMRLSPTKEYCFVFDFQDNIKGCAFKNHAFERNRIYREQKFPTQITEITI
ncbi:DEAD/DEAH box helicase family protein [Candidatus Dojkabacteria bacterium]|jgi:superfamily II DNA or RNA helicase|nr:DEAD/DEAH box helicase family protein [Candidatus Dojkabacteria bacterium]